MKTVGTNVESDICEFDIDNVNIIKMNLILLRLYKSILLYKNFVCTVQNVARFKLKIN